MLVFCENFQYLYREIIVKKHILVTLDRVYRFFYSSGKPTNGSSIQALRISNRPSEVSVKEIERDEPHHLGDTV